MLTTFDLDEYVYEALRAGASGFLLKDTPPEQLVDGDPRRRARATRCSRRRSRSALIEEFVRGRPADRDAPSAERRPTSPRASCEVLGLIARGLSNAEIAGDLFVSETTVKTHVARILMKLDLRDRVQAVVFAYETGLVQPGSRRRLGRRTPMRASPRPSSARPAAGLRGP